MPGTRVRHRGRRRAAWIALLALVVIAGIVAGAVVAQRAGSKDKTANGSSTSSSTPTPTTPSSNTVSSSAAPQMPATLRACVNEVQAQDTLVKAMAKGIDDLAHHVQAMHDNWAGKISVDQMKAMWKETRLAGPSDLAAYSRTTAASRKTGHPCTSLSPSKLPASYQKQATSCRDRSSALADAVVAGEPAMNEWAYHLKQMALFKQGAFDTATANRRWLQVYDATPPLVARFDHAMSAVDSAPACA